VGHMTYFKLWDPLHIFGMVKLCSSNLLHKLIMYCS